MKSAEESDRNRHESPALREILSKDSSDAKELDTSRESAQGAGNSHRLQLDSVRFNPIGSGSVCIFADQSQFKTKGSSVNQNVEQNGHDEREKHPAVKIQLATRSPQH